MADIFVSYSKKDHEFARALVLALQAEGYSVWWDASLVSGEEFRKVIMTELGQARAVIVIWTQNSVASDWVQSEAGRAHADRKLIPVKERGLSYRDVPPPFDNMHIENVDDREKILGAVVAQLAKPAEQTSRASRGIARTKLELLSWFGILGAIITLVTNLRGVLTLADWMDWLLQRWGALVHGFWRSVFFFLPDLSHFDSIILTLSAFIGATFAASLRPAPLPKRSLLARVALCAAAWLAMLSAMGILLSSDPPVASSSPTDSYYSSAMRHLDRTLKSAGIDIEAIAKAGPLLVSPTLAGRLLAVPIILVFAALMTVLALAPVIPVLAAIAVAGRLTGRRLSLGAFTARLWRILAGVVIVIVLNAVYTGLRGYWA